MRRLSSNPKVLLCTAYQRFPGDYWDILRETVRSLPRVSFVRRVSPGLRFIKQNVPEVEILEYPLWHEYAAKLKEGWDVVGFSVYQNEIGEILRMADEARRQGVRELWAGNYGAMDEVMPRVFDRVFLGAAEDEVAQAFGYRVRDVEHPVMSWGVNFLPGRIPYMKLGLMYTQHGCPFRCTFCQAAVFNKKRISVNVESIDRALRYYRSVGMTDVLILDELFGINPSQTEKVTELLARHKMRWWAESRPSIFTRHLDTWHERGLRFPMVGVETMSQICQDMLHKKQKVEEIVEFGRRTKEKRGMYPMSFFIIGYENMTAEDTIRDVIAMKHLGFSAHGIGILTPFPGTPLWHHVESKYGIFDKTYRHFDAGHLVWRHPYISPKLMRYLRMFALHCLNKPINIYVKTFAKLIRDRFLEKGFEFVWRDIIKNPLSAITHDERKQVFFPKLALKGSNSRRSKPGVSVSRVAAKTG